MSEDREQMSQTKVIRWPTPNNENYLNTIELFSLHLDSQSWEQELEQKQTF